MTGPGDSRNTVTVAVPDLGGFADVAVIEVLVRVGDRVEIDTPLITLESDKATMDVPSSAAGVIESLLVRTGDKVSTGSAVAVLRLASPESTAETQTRAALQCYLHKPAIVVGRNITAHA